MENPKDILHPGSCCYAKGIGYSILTERNVVKKDTDEADRDFRSRVLHYKHEKFNSIFAEIFDFEVNYDVFRIRFQKFQTFMLKWGKSNSADKKQFLETFCEEKWSELSRSSKVEHTFTSCKKCSIIHHDMQGKLPIPKGMQGISKENLIHQAQSVNIQNTKQSTSTKVLKDCANTIHMTIEKKFQDKFGKSYTETLTKVKSLNLQIKPSKVISEKTKRANTKKDEN